MAERVKRLSGSLVSIIRNLKFTEKRAVRFLSFQTNEQEKDGKADRNASIFLFAYFITNNYNHIFLKPCHAQCIAIPVF